MKKTETICALATAIGQSGIGIVRISGPLSQSIAKHILNVSLKPRSAYYGDFFDQNGNIVDKGVAIFFPTPNSYTGEDILELQGHGGINVLRCLLEAANHFGARFAEPGEFSKRAFLNGKMDLVQAEAVQDLIQASSEQSARCAVRSLSGEFSEKINSILSSITELRVFVEATIDFSDEDIELLESHEVYVKIKSLEQDLHDILDGANQGSIIREGLYVAIAGKPNAGKSSLLNALTKRSSAIVTDIAGTTRDVLKETVQIDGLPIHIIDTAGLHDSDDIIEKEGIRRAHNEIDNADVVLLVYEAQDQSADHSILPNSMNDKPIVAIRNKIDLNAEEALITQQDKNFSISLSAKTGNGVNLLEDVLIKIAGYNPVGEEIFLARKRHLLAIDTTLKYITNAAFQFHSGAIELVAEDLRQAGMSLGSITGEFSSDDLLGQIFSSFCIGK